MHGGPARPLSLTGAVGVIVEELKFEDFIKIIPPVTLKIVVIKLIAREEISVVENCIENLTVKHICLPSKYHQSAQLIFHTEDNFNNIKQSFLKIKYEQLKKTSNFSIFIKNENVTTSDLYLNSPLTQYNKQCKTVAKAISKIITNSINEELQKKCQSLVMNYSNKQSIVEILQSKLENIS